MIAFPLIWLSLAFLGGVFFSSIMPFALHYWLLLALVIFTAGAAWWIIARSRGWRPFGLTLGAQTIVIACGVLFAVGAARYEAVQPVIDPFEVAWYNDREYEILVTGIVDEPPDYRDQYTNLRIRVESVDTGLKNPLPVTGYVLARVPANETFSYGERVRLRGYLVTPPENEDFSYRDYLASRGIHAYMSSAIATHLPDGKGNPVFALIYSIRDKALANTYEIFPDPEASLMAGILLGVDTGMSRELQQAFKDTGTAHVIAISGFNIAIISGIFLLIFGRLLGKRWGSLVAILGIAFYTLLVGADAAVVRAAVMGIISILALQAQKRQFALNTLAFVAGAMCAVNPYFLWDVGFQLSFMATLGLVLFAEPLGNLAAKFASRYLPADKAKSVVAPVSEFFLLTLAAQLTTLPVMAYHFGSVSLISIIANPFILPAQPPLMILGGLAVLASLVAIPLGKAIALIAWVFPAYTIRLVEFFSQFSSGVLYLGDVSLGLVLTFYVVLFFVYWKWQSVVKWKAYVTPGVVAAGLGVMSVLVWRSVFLLPDGKLHITFFPVGASDAVLIQTPSGGYVLVNGGESASVLSQSLGERLPPTDRNIDWLVVASTQQNQLAALPRVIERYSPQNVLWSGRNEASYASRNLLQKLAEMQIPVTTAKAGQILDLGDGATLTFLSVTQRGSVMLLEWKSFRALLPIGMSFASLAELDYGRSVGPVTLLTLADSGYAPVNPPEWFQNLRPQAIILSVDAGNKDGLPSPETLETIEGYQLLRTDRLGWIEVSTDGSQMQVTSQK